MRTSLQGKELLLQSSRLNLFGVNILQSKAECGEEGSQEANHVETELCDRGQQDSAHYGQQRQVDLYHVDRQQNTSESNNYYDESK